MNDLKKLIKKVRTCPKCKFINGGIAKEYLWHYFKDGAQRNIIVICPKCSHKWSV